jgi:hypothetical protein
MHASFNKSIICCKIMYLDTHGVSTLWFRESENINCKIDVRVCGNMQEQTSNYEAPFLF